MRIRVLLSALAFVLVLSACNLPSNVPPTATPTLGLVTPAVTQILPTDTPIPTSLPSNTPLPPPTSTPSVPVALPKEVGVNCRLGPGTAWVVLSGLAVGASSQIVGKTADGGWWYIVDPFNSGRNCWISASVTNTDRKSTRLNS